jgi:diguanylate cyclase (GGDEF)-like protein/PAS domain S-box-containing protein
VGGNQPGQPEEILAVALTEADRREQARIEAVHALGLLERPVSEGMERVVALAAELCGTTNATINIVDEDWLHSIAAVGGPQGSFPREDIPCDRVVRTGQELIIPDATATPILADSPVVDGSLAAMGFYASVPMRTVGGHVVGTLCAYDETPHPFSDDQLKMLRILADHAISLFQMADALERAQHATERLAQQAREARDLADVTLDPYYAFGGDLRISSWNPAAERAFGWTAAEAVGADVIDLLTPGRSRPVILERIRGWRPGTTMRQQSTVVCRDGSEKAAELQIWSSGDEAGWHVFAREAAGAGESERGRRAAEQLLTAALDHSPNGIAVVGVTGPQAGRILRANAVVHTLTGRSELAGLPFAEVVSGPAPDARRPQSPTAADDEIDRRALLEDFDLLVSQPAGTFRNDSLEHRTRVPVGPGHIFVHLVITLTRDAEGHPEHALVQMRDVTTQHAHEQWLIRQTQTDQLTGLGNRLALQERLAQEVAWLRTGHGGLGVLMIDLDNSRAVNDSLGRPAGDDLLCRMATALTGSLPEDAFGARLGADQFVVLAPGGSAESMDELADRVGAALGEAADNFAARLGVQVGASLGTMFTQNPATDPEELLKAADSAMYENKRRRRERRPGLHAVPSPRGAETAPLPAPTPAPRHVPGPGETPHPAHSRKP